MSSETPDHHCPGCGIPQRAFARYPWYFCQNCLKLVVGVDGKQLEFANASLGGGLVWRYQGDEDWSDAVMVICRIKSRPVMVHEARFGGIVAEPLHDGPLHDKKHITDLRRS